MKFRNRFLSLVFLMVLLVAQLSILFNPVWGTDFSLTPSKDSYIYQFAPDTNYGSVGYIYVASYWKDGDEVGKNRRSFIEFSIAAIPEAEGITSATLCVYAYSGVSGRTYNIDRITGSWAEDTVTWDAQPAATTTNRVSAGSPTAAGWWNSTVTNMVKDARNAGTTAGFRIIDSVEDSAVSKQSIFYSKEFDSYDAVLLITYELPVTPPTYSNITASDFQADLPCTFNATWNSGSGTLDKYSYEHNNTGSFTTDIYPFPPEQTVGYSNVTMTLNPTPYVTIHWRITANNTDGSANSTDWQYLLVFPQTPPMQRTVLGYSNIGGRNALYVKGATYAVYCVWTNSSTSKYQVAAFDEATREWTQNYDIANAESPEEHYRPSIGIMPNGSLIIFYGHFEPIYERHTKYSTATETNLTKIISNWGNQQTVPDLPEVCSYPDTLTLGDTMILWCRMEWFYNWSIKSYTTAGGWGATRNIINAPAFGQVYMEFPKKWNETMIIWSACHYNATVGYRDVYFMYSNDKGATFKDYKGTALSTPISDLSKIRVYSSGVSGVYAITCPSLDADLHIYIPYHSYPYSKLLYYTGTIGNNDGSWQNNYVNITTSSEAIKAIIYPYYDSYYDAISFWCSPKNGFPDPKENFTAGYATKFVQDPQNKFKFHAIYQNTTASASMSATSIINSPIAYDVYGSELRDNIIGYQVKGSTSLNLTNQDLIWGTKFTATSTERVLALHLRIYWSGAQGSLHGKAAIYDNNFNLISGGAEMDIVGGATFQGLNDWCKITLPGFIQINEGTDYWLCFKIAVAEQNVVSAFKDSGTTNQTFYYNHTYATAWPSSLSPTYYENNKISEFCISKVLVCAGLGFPPEAYGRSAGQSLTFSLDVSKLFEITRPITQAISMALSGTRQFDITRMVSQGIGINLLTDRIADFLRGVTQIIITLLSVSCLIDWKRGASQLVGISLQAARLFDITKTPSQIIGISLVGNRVFEVTKDATQLITVSLTSSRVADFFRVAVQAIAFSLSGGRLPEFLRQPTQVIGVSVGVGRSVEFFRFVSQLIAFSLQGIGEKIAFYLRDAALLITASFQSSRLAEWLRMVSQGINIGLASSRIGEFFRNVAQTIIFSLNGARLAEFARSVSQTFDIGFVTSKIAGFFRSVFQSIGFVLDMGRIAEFYVGASQSIIITFNAQRLGELFRSVSQAVTFSFQGIGEKIGLYFRNAILTLTISPQSSRLAEWFKAASQSVSLTIQSTRLPEFFRTASQSIGLSLQAKAILSYLISAVLTLTISLNSIPLVEIIRQVSQTLTFTFSTQRTADFLRTATQAFNFNFVAAQVTNFFRSAAQTITTILNAERLAEFFRFTSQSITLTLQGIGEMLGNYFRTAFLTITTLLSTVGLVPETMIALALAVALIVVACVVTYAVATTLTEK